MNAAPDESATFVYIMDTVGVRELRQNLSAALERVKQGERLIVTDRNRPVAQLIPLNAEAPGLARLIAEGKVTEPAAKLEISPVRLEGEYVASRALEYVRGERD